MALTRTECAFRLCDVPTALRTRGTYCTPAHRVAEHRLRVADIRALDAERRANAHRLLVEDATASLLVGNVEAALAAVTDAAAILARKLP